MESNRKKKKAIQDGVAKLRAKPGWDPQKVERDSPERALERLASETATSAAYAEAPACKECLARQAELGDRSALCDTHLAQAMGL